MHSWLLHNDLVYEKKNTNESLEVAWRFMRAKVTDQSVKIFIIIWKFIFFTSFDFIRLFNIMRLYLEHKRECKQIFPGKRAKWIRHFFFKMKKTKKVQEKTKKKFNINRLIFLSLVLKCRLNDFDSESGLVTFLNYIYKAVTFSRRLNKKKNQWNWKLEHCLHDQLPFHHKVYSNFFFRSKP